jgi:single-stranded DNA-binding protein
MTDTITLTGIVATIPRVLKTSDDLAITSFRLASTQRRFDRNRNRWVDGEPYIQMEQSARSWLNILFARRSVRPRRHR